MPGIGVYDGEMGINRDEIDAGGDSKVPGGCHAREAGTGISDVGADWGIAIFSGRVTNPGICNFLFLEEFVILLTDGIWWFMVV